MNDHASETLRVKLRYLANDQDLVIYMASVAGGEVAPHQGNFEEKIVAMENGRNGTEQFSLDRQGFQLLKHASKTVDYFDDSQIANVYNNEIEKLVMESTGAARVEVFDNTRRASSEATRKQKQVREQAATIHNDYTDYSAPKRLREILPAEADSLLQRRYAIVNVWQSIAGMVENYPLTLCDVESMDVADLVAVKRQAKDRIGEIQFATFNPNHRWVYFPKMKMDEVLMFKTFDSAKDGRARFTIHSSFEDPTAPKDAPVRESIETRCFVFY
jgi:hypothetical protein